MTPVTLLPSVSIVIPAYNEEAVLERCIAAAIDQTVAAHEIIVVDNRSTDRTARIAQGFADSSVVPVRLIGQHVTQGLIPTRNAGFEAATGAVLGRIDADSIVDRDWVRNVGALMLNTGVSAVTGPVSYYDLRSPWIGGVVDDLARRTLRRLGSQYPFLYGSNMAIRSSAWQQIQAHACQDAGDELHEDIDLAVHLYEAGLEVAYSSNMRAGVSLRRLDSTYEEFSAYRKRFERTYASHDVDVWYLKAPQVLLAALYWPLRLSRPLFDQPGEAAA